jgi:tyrosine-protein kinase Etk/Wzc
MGEDRVNEERSIAGLILGWRPLIVRVTLAAAVIAVIASLLMPNWYGAAATFLPPEERESGVSLARVFSQMGMDFGGGGVTSSTPASDLMLGVVKSRLIRGQVVDRFGLVDAYETETRDHAIEDLGDHLRVSTTSEGLIEVWVEDRDPRRAADMANAFVEFLDEYNRRTSVERARRTRELVGSIIEENRDRLEDAAARLREFQEEHDTVELSEQTRVTVEAIAQLESELAKLEIEKGLREDFSSPNQMEMRQLDARIREIEAKIAELRDGRGGPSGGALLPMSSIPGLGLKLADLTREVMAQEKVYTFLQSQYEEARIQESRDMEVIHVLDAASPPLKKHRPRRSVIVMLTVILALVGSVGLAFAAEGLLEYAAKGPAGLALGDSRDSRILLGFLRRLREWGGPKGERERPASPSS